MKIHSKFKDVKVSKYVSLRSDEMGGWQYLSHSIILRNNDYIHMHVYVCVQSSCMALGGSLNRLMRSAVPKVPFTFTFMIPLRIIYVSLLESLHSDLIVSLQTQIKASLIILKMSHNILMACFSEELGEVKVSTKLLCITCSFCSNHLVLLIMFFSVEIYYYANTFLL